MLDVTIEHDVPATRRDGVVLRADVYRPAADEPWPVLSSPPVIPAPVKGQRA
ncbi:hypothetical protein [Nocardia sp. alder85J]|uniref:hypothetical protein n=1 Tax=Nocardia sp. alder85J TaxID=2862949 RepID=UPI001CD55821|nr:hypothetical protein [Nocardia sp. alder85J]MCX4091076.1 hypothetical protein [Nocardia sp. alder85J]